ncbi:MAG: SDR family oxidoreductase [Anaerolineales bacterium]|nr:SDR family oxidoreductase [Anaerolineales bacterium]
MKLVVFGATGRTGRYVVEKALEEGHAVTAFVRDPQKAPWDRPGLQLQQGDVRNLEQVKTAVKGADAVISVLGPSDNTDERVITRGTQNIVEAMRQHGVQRLVASCGAGVEFPQDDPNLFNNLMGFLVQTFSTNVYEDMKETAEVIRASELDWTIVRVPMLADGPPKGGIRVGYVGRGTGPRVTRQDMARFMLEQVDREEYLRDAPVISN